MATETKPQSQTMVKKTVTPADEVKNTIMSEEVKKQLSMVLPPQMPVERFQRVAITAINKNPDLVDCNRQSLYNAFMQCAQDGLLPDGNEAAIVKYNSKDGAPNAQYQPMVKGILKKIRNSGELKSIMATCIHQHDPFRYWVDDDGEHLTHEPDLFTADRGKIIGAYALAKTKDDAIYIKVMTTTEIELVRSFSKAKNAGPWTNWWDQMAEKTVIRRLAKRMPMSTDLDDFLRRDDDLIDTEVKVADTDTASQGRKGTPSRLTKMLGEKGQIVEGTATETGSTEEPLITVDEDPAEAAAEKERIANRQKELDEQKKLLKSGAPSPEEQEEIKRKEIFDAKAMQCAKCPPYTFATDDADEMKQHMADKHPNGNAKKETNQPAKPSGGLFGSK